MAANTYRNESDLQVNYSHSTSRAMKYVLGAYDLEPRFCADRFPSAVDQWRTWLHISKANLYPVIGSRSALKLDEAKREPQQCPPIHNPLPRLSSREKDAGAEAAQPQPCECGDSLGRWGWTRHPRQDSYTAGIVTYSLATPSRAPDKLLHRHLTSCKHAVDRRRRW
jgi:hypothetical protein